MSKSLDLTDHVYGHLTVLKIATREGRKSWECRCSCGNTTIVAQKELRNGDTKSCGCLRKGILVARNKNNKVDHDKLTREERYTYGKWRGMRARCNNPYGKSKCYRAVSICPTWEDFYVFLSNMGTCPKGYSLERKDNSKGYTKDNCKWVPLGDQNKNTSRNRFVHFNGRTKILSDHARDIGLEPDLVFDRVNKLGWDTDRALGTPKRVKPH